MKSILAILIGFIIGTISGHICGWILPFLLFGDGSNLYFGLKSFGVEPYAAAVVTLTILGAIAGGVAGYLYIKFEKR
ncbi:hypothetical protein [Desulfoscipio geothermicus]|uniref:hypothetical protein n=1 Tax=Desulfoscipio geothermicus TaxID=39060 RepID=UPI000B8190BB|nr:hypothetical protein [Desulfoscipio geothermicus]